MRISQNLPVIRLFSPAALRFIVRSLFINARFRGTVLAMHTWVKAHKKKVLFYACLYRDENITFTHAFDSAISQSANMQRECKYFFFSWQIERRAIVVIGMSAAGDMRAEKCATGSLFEKRTMDGIEGTNRYRQVSSRT